MPTGRKPKPCLAPASCSSGTVRGHFYIFMLLCFCVLLCGCSDAGAKITSQQVQQTAAQVQQFNQQVADYQQLEERLVADLKAKGILDANTSAAIDKINTQVKLVQAQVAVVTAAVVAVPVTTNNDLQNTVAQLQAANAASPPWPYKDIATIIFACISAVLAWLANQKSKDAAAAKTDTAVAKQTLRAVTKAVDMAPDEVQAVIKPAVAVNLAVANITNTGELLITASKQ